jgi:hypothetical protein
MRIQKLIALPLILFLFTCCHKEDNGESGDPAQSLVFNALTAEKDTLTSGETTKVTASASGYKLSYTWAATLGDILGSGSSVVYATSPCSIGKITITCTVKDGNEKSQSKSTIIVVK